MHPHSCCQDDCALCRWVPCASWGAAGTWQPPNRRLEEDNPESLVVMQVAGKCVAPPWGQPGVLNCPGCRMPVLNLLLPAPCFTEVEIRTMSGRNIAFRTCWWRCAYELWWLSSAVAVGCHYLHTWQFGCRCTATSLQLSQLSVKVTCPCFICWSPFTPLSQKVCDPVITQRTSSSRQPTTARPGLLSLLLYQHKQRQALELLPAFQGWQLNDARRLHHIGPNLLCKVSSSAQHMPRYHPTSARTGESGAATRPSANASSLGCMLGSVQRLQARLR